MPADAAYRVVVRELASVGLDPGAVCAAAGLDPSVLENEAAPFGSHALARVLERAEAMAGDPLLGLHAGERAQGHGVLSYLARAQRTVGDGLRALERFAGTVWGGGGVRLQRRGAFTFVAFLLGPALPRHAAEYLVTRVAVSLRRDGAGPREAWLEHAPGGDTREYERVLGCPVRFRQPATGLSLHDQDLARPRRTANPQAAEALVAALTRQPAWRAASTSARLAAAVEDALARGQLADRETLARSLGMSGKTLARRLASERRHFRDVIDEVRRLLALRLLVEESLDVGEVAARVGFGDSAALGKAFRRWFGKSPSAVRARRRTG